jgi:hypothetical protein
VKLANRQRCSMNKVERVKFKDIVIPSTALCRVCRLQVTDICGGCLENKLSEFEPKSIPFGLLRTFTMKEYTDLPNGAKGKILAYYLIQIMEILNGRDPDDTPGRSIFTDK